jgi:hypothetical protein
VVVLLTVVLLMVLLTVLLLMVVLLMQVLFTGDSMPALLTPTPTTTPHVSLVNSSSQTQLPLETRIRQDEAAEDFHERGHTYVQPRRSALPTVTSARARAAARHDENDRMAAMVKKRLKDDSLVQLSRLAAERGGRVGDERRDAAYEPGQPRDDGEEEPSQPVEGGSVEGWRGVERHGGGSSSSDGDGGRGEALRDLFVLWNAPVHSWTGTASEAINLLVPLAQHVPGLGLVGGYDDQYVAEYAGRAGDAETLAAMRARGQVKHAYHCAPTVFLLLGLIISHMSSAGAGRHTAP